MKLREGMKATASFVRGTRIKNYELGIRNVLTMEATALRLVFLHVEIVASVGNCVA